MAWKPAYLLLIMLSTLSVFLCALAIYKQSEKKIRKRYLVTGLFINLGILFIFKYFNFFAFSLDSLLSIFSETANSPVLKLLLPVGISFYTFQAGGYLIDVYRGKLSAEKHLGYFALFVSFFPQLVAGPIERADKLLPQLRSMDGKIGYENFSAGLKLILFGLFKKMVVADNLAFMVNEVYGHPHEYGGFQFALATILFSFQIYCDFSGYTDIAVGSARIFGIRLMNNFRTPYFATSVSEFWRRWHISLSTWFRDYLFLPLAYHYSRKLPKQKYLFVKTEYLIYAIAIFITFTITGLWHGAAWTFVLWGLLHAILLIVEYAGKKGRRKIQRKLSVIKASKPLHLSRLVSTFIFVSLCFLFFRAENIGDGIIIFKGIFTAWDSFSVPYLANNSYFYGGIIALLMLVAIEAFARDRDFDLLLANKNIFIRWSFYYILLGMIFFCGYFGEVEFIYFQF